MLLKKLVLHIRTTLIAGLLAILPIGVTIFVLKFFFELLDPILGPIFNMGNVQIFPGLGVIVLLIFITTNNFFYNFYYILKTNISDRMIYHYGYCQKNGFGFIKYINNKHKLNKNIKIYNSVEYPLSDWFFYKPNIP